MATFERPLHIGKTDNFTMTLSNKYLDGEVIINSNVTGGVPYLAINTVSNDTNTISVVCYGLSEGFAELEFTWATATRTGCETYRVEVVACSAVDGRVSALLNKARITLGDKAMDRYSDADLLLLLDEGQKDFCKSTKILKESIQVDIKDGEYLLPLPDDSWILTRATYDGEKLPLLTYTDVDNIVNRRSANTLGLSEAWEDDVGEPKAIIYNKNNLGTVRLFPQPENTYEEMLNDPFGVLAEFSTVTSDDTVAVNAGVVSSVEEYKPLKMHVIKTAPDLTMDGPLVIPPMFDVALKYYIVAHSFLNDLDGGWQEKGLQQLRFYEREVEKAKDSEALNHTVNDSPSTYYRNGF